MAQPQDARAAFRKFADMFPEVPTASMKDIQQWRAEGHAVVLVDCRDKAERAISIIPEAISMEEFTKTGGQKGCVEGTRIVPYCTIGYRSGLLCRQLQQEGVAHVHNGEGVLLWLHDGGTLLASDGTPTRRVHVYNSKFDFAPAGCETVKYGIWDSAKSLFSMFTG